jgi:hypothetical protein
MPSPSTLVLVPAGGSNFEIAADRTSGPLAGQLPAHGAWERQALIEAAMTLGWQFQHQQQLDGEGGSIQLTFERASVGG